MVQFESLTGLTSAHIGLFWKEVIDRFPKLQEQVPLPSVPIERAGSRQGSLQLEIAHGPRTRMWLVDDQDRELVQIQHDRFVRNWRKTGEDDTYPRYENHIRPRFKEDFDNFVRFASLHGIGDVKPLQCEVAYFNQIRPAESVWSSLSDMYKATSTHTPPTLSELPVQYEGSQLRDVFSIIDKDQFIGRLYAEITPVEEDGQPTVRYHLTARGHPKQPTVEGAMEFLDMGRRLIVECFDRSTSPKMHRVWGKE